MDEPLQFAAEDVLLIFAGGVVETFHKSYDRSFRTPAAWVGVFVEPRRHDRVRFTVGRTADPTMPVYSTERNLSWNDVQFDLDATSEPGVRGFFAAVAQAAARG